MERRTLRSLALLALLALASSPFSLAGSASSRDLFVWAMEASHYHEAMPALVHGAPDLVGWRRDLGLGKDFLAVFDMRPGAAFGRLVAMLPAGDAVMAHHMNYAEPPDGMLYANDWLGDRTDVFDLRDPRVPRLVRQFGSIG